MRASLASGQDALSTNPATRTRTYRAPPDRRLVRGALSLGYFSLGKQRKVTRPPAGGRKHAAGEPSRRNATTKRKANGSRPSHHLSIRRDDGSGEEVRLDDLLTLLATPSAPAAKQYAPPTPADPPHCHPCATRAAPA